MKWYWHVGFLIMVLTSSIGFYGEYKITGELFNSAGSSVCLWILLWCKCYDYDVLKSRTLDLIAVLDKENESG